MHTLYGQGALNGFLASPDAKRAKARKPRPFVSLSVYQETEKSHIIEYVTRFVVDLKSVSRSCLVVQSG